MRQKPKPNMLISRFLGQNKIENVERSALLAFNRGFATERHFNTLTDIYNLLNTAHQLRPNTGNGHALDMFSEALDHIKATHKTTGKFEFSYDDNLAMTHMINFNAVYWNGHSSEFYSHCIQEVNKFYEKKLREKQNGSGDI